jgi:hypothetical protein
MTTEFRDPTGIAPWPIGLIAGVEKAGKSLKCVEASASELIHMTYWIGIGEDDPDEYGAFEGARFKIARHDGTLRGILDALRDARLMPAGEDGKPNLIVVDSGTRGWDLIKDMAQATQNERYLEKCRKRGEKVDIPEEGIKPTTDLWNTANDRWEHVLNELRAHQGPSLITARLEHQVVMDGNGQPTRERHWKVISQKFLPYDVGFIVQMRGSYPEVDNYLTGVKSLRYQHKTRRGKVVATPLADDFTVESIWRALGVHENVTPREHAHLTPVDEETLPAKRTALFEQIKANAEAAGVTLQEIATDWAEAHHGQPIREASDLGGLELVRDDLRVRAELRAQNPAPAEEPARAPEPAPAQDAQSAQDAQPEPTRTRAPQPEETNQQRIVRMVGEEFTYQAEVLGVPVLEHAKPGIAVPTDLRTIVLPRATDYLKEQRPVVIDALRAAGRSTEADAYERMGDAPFVSIEHITGAEQFERERV